MFCYYCSPLIWPTSLKDQTVRESSTQFMWKGNPVLFRKLLETPFHLQGCRQQLTFVCCYCHHRQHHKSYYCKTNHVDCRGKREQCHFHIIIQQRNKQEKLNVPPIPLYSHTILSQYYRIATSFPFALFHNLVPNKIIEITRKCYTVTQFVSLTHCYCCRLLE